jgi:hypothetical protein
MFELSAEYRIDSVWWCSIPGVTTPRALKREAKAVVDGDDAKAEKIAQAIVEEYGI